MQDAISPDSNIPPEIPVSATEVFLSSVEAKTASPLHKRLLKAAQGRDSKESIEVELRKIVAEIIHEN